MPLKLHSFSSKKPINFLILTKAETSFLSMKRASNKTAGSVQISLDFSTLHFQTHGTLIADTTFEFSIY